MNNENNNFEYISEPQYLRATEDNNACQNLQEIVQRCCKWVENNDQLSVQRIFEHLDLTKSGELPKHHFVLALKEIGIKLHPSEIELLEKVLDKRDLGFYTYGPFVRELKYQVPHLLFYDEHMQKLAKGIVEKNIG